MKTILFKGFEILTQRVAGCAVASCVALVTLLPLAANAATLQEVITSIKQQIEAKPAEAPAILEKSLRELPGLEQLRYASGAYAAALGGVEKNADRVLRLLEKAVPVVPRAVVALVEVAYRTAPDRILEITEIAIREVIAAGLDELVPAIVARAVTLAPEQRDALLRLAAGMVSPALMDLIRQAVAEAVASPGAEGVTAINGTMNPANVGGNVVSPEQ